MRRRALWLLALAALAWFWMRRGARRPQPLDDVLSADDPADELRRKLDETKEHVDDAAQAVGTAAEQATEDVDEKRRDVHDRAQSAADEMRRSSSD